MDLGILTSLALYTIQMDENYLFKDWREEQRASISWFTPQIAAKARAWRARSIFWVSLMGGSPSIWAIFELLSKEPIGSGAARTQNGVHM